MSRLVVLSLFLVLGCQQLFAQNLQHFTVPGYGGDSYSIIVQSASSNGSALQAGDEIAAYDDGNGGPGLIAAVAYDGQYPVVMTAHMQNSSLNLTGAVPGNPITFKMWRASEQKEYSASAVFLSGGHFGDSYASAVSSLSSTGEPLPVELTFFSASANGNKVALKWATATELNNYGFEIERAYYPSSGSQGGFEKIAFIKGSGNSSSVHTYAYEDKTESCGKYIYRLKQIDADGTYKYSQEVEVLNSAPSGFALSQNYPNPFNPSTKINFTLKSSADVQLTVYNAIGEKVALLLNENKEAGNYAISFDAKNLSSGIYYYTLRAGTNYAVKKMNLIK